MNLLQGFKSKIKLFLIVAAVSAILAVGGILLLQRFQQAAPTSQPQIQDTIPPQVRKSFATQEECETQTGYRCDFVNCDINCPAGFQKGWSATDVKIEQALDTSTWQTYRSDEFGFEVKYPEDLVLEEGAIVRQGSGALRLPDSYLSGTSLTGAEIDFSMAEGSCRRSESPEDTYHIQGEVTYNQVPFQIASWFYTPPVYGYEYSTQKNNLCVGITLVLHGDVNALAHTRPEMKPLFDTMDQILSTFRFIESSETPTDSKHDK